MQVKEIMSKDIITVKRSTTLKQLLKLFGKFHTFPLVPVVDEQSLLVGVVSFRNLINAFKPLEPEMLKTVPFLDEKDDDIFKMDFTEGIGDLVIVEDIMERQFIYTEEDVSLENCFKLMKLRLKEEIPVKDKAGKLVGMVGIFDIMRYVFKQKGVI